MSAMNRLFPVVLIAFGASTLAGCRPGSIDDLNAPEALTLYSINGGEAPVEQKDNSAENFHGSPVLGKTEITDAATRREIIAAIKKGMADSDGTMAKCFWPRHAIRAMENGKTTDYVICFQCLQLAIHEADDVRIEPITTSPKATLNQQLQSAGVRLAPDPTDGHQ